MAYSVDQWFMLADEDRDGGVGGAEAVRFFTKSGLPQDVLGQIWEFASGGGAKLNLAQFGVAMRLVSLAQASGGRLNPDQARMVAMGGGPQLAPPRLAGITDAPTPSISTYTPQITGLSPQPSAAGSSVGYAPQQTGGYVPQVTGGYQPQMTGGMRPPGPYPPATTGQGAYVPQPTGGYAAAGPTGGMTAAGVTGAVVLPGFPPVTPADIQRYQAAFLATDTDRDGFAKGSECFPLFMKSGLDKALLKRMWDLVAGNAGSLNQEQFLKCMYLMDGCRRGAVLPAVLPPGPWPQVTAAAGPTGAPMPSAPAAAAGMTGTLLPLQQQQQPGLQPMPTGAIPGQPLAAAAAGGVAGVAAAAAGGMTGVAAGSMTGSVPGGLPPAPRMSSGSGAAPISATPSYLQPAGPAALRAESWTLDSQFGHKGAVKAISDAYDQTLPKIPDLPGKVTYEAKAAAAAAGPSSVPDLDMAVASMLAPADKERWEAERQEALKKEEEQRKAEADAAAAKARIEAFQAALSELVMYKSRVDVAVLQSTDAAARLTAEAEDTEIRYNKARLAAESQAEEGNAVRQKLQALLARKQEAANKLQLLQEEISMMANINPAELAALEQEVGTLVAQMTAAEAKKAALEMQLDSGKKQKALLTERMSDLELAAAAGEGDIRRARQELAELEAKAAAAQAAAQGSSGLADVGPLLGKAASAYRRLYSSAAAAGLEIPYEANLNNVGSLVWLEQLMAGAADWVDDDAAVSGYAVVNALPDLEGVPPALLRAAAVAAAQQPPVKPAAVAAGRTAAAPAEAAATPADAAAAEQLGAETAVAVQPNKGAVAAVAATTAAAAAAAGAVAAAVAGSDEAAETDKAAVPEAPSEAAEAAAVAEDGEVAAAAPAAAAAEGTDAAFADTAFEDNAFGDNAFAVTAADGPVADAELHNVPVDDAAVAEAAAEPPASAISAEISELDSHADTAVVDATSADGVAAAESADVGITSPVQHVADEDDSDILSAPVSPGLLSAVPITAAANAGAAPVIGGLAGFDPAMYRLDPDQHQMLAPQYSIDSSYAGSIAGGAAAAGGTGASSSGFGDDAFGDSSSGQHGEGKPSAGLIGFEDNAF